MTFDRDARPPGRKAGASERPSRNFGALTCACLLAYGTTALAFAQQLPTGGTVTAGSATIAQRLRLSASN